MDGHGSETETPEGSTLAAWSRPGCTAILLAPASSCPNYSWAAGPGKNTTEKKFYYEEHPTMRKTFVLRRGFVVLRGKCTAGKICFASENRMDWHGLKRIAIDLRGMIWLWMIGMYYGWIVTNWHRFGWIGIDLNNGVFN